MSTFSIQTPSGTTNGKMVAVAATSSPGTLLHAAVSDSGDTDEITVYACNVSGAIAELTIEFGGTATSDKIIAGIPSKDGLHLVVPAGRLGGAASLNARAYCATGANLINCLVLVNRDS